MTTAEMYRTEELQICRGKGETAGHGGVVIGNAAIASRYNPIPGILEDLERRPCKENHYLVKMRLMSYFVSIKICTSKDSVDVAEDVIRWYLNPHCTACHGTGLKNKEQETCPVCLGVPQYPRYAPSNKAAHEIQALFMWREKQLRRRNSD